MPITFHQIASNTATVTLHVGEDTVTVVYYPGRVTEKTIKTMMSFANLEQSQLEEGFRSFNTVFTTLIKSWDVMEEEKVFDGPFDTVGKLTGKMVMFPLRVDRLEELPVFFRVQVVNAIMEDLRPEAIAPQMNR